MADLALAWQKAGPEAAHLLRREGARIGPLLAKAVEADAIDPEEAVAAVAAADPSGEGLLGWTDHPDPAARRASLLAAAASGHPAAPGRIRELGRDGDAAVAAAARAAASGSIASRRR